MWNMSLDSSLIARKVFASISKSNWAEKRIARRIRKASSENLARGFPTQRINRLSRSSNPPKGSTKPSSG